MARFGLVGAERLGASVPALRQLGRQLGHDHTLALALWDSGIPDAQLLASLVADPAALTVAQMNAWTRSMQSWDVCDQACLNAFRRSPLAWMRIPVWARSSALFTRRAAFSLLAVMAVHDKARPDADFAARLALVEQIARIDERPLVRKALSWALRQTGKRSATLREDALAVAARLRERPEAGARWVGGDAWRELRGRGAQRKSSGAGRSP